MQKTTLATLAALLGYSIFGFSFLFSKIALNQTTPFILLSIRFLAAFAVMNLIVLVRRVPLRLKGKPVKMLLLLGFIQPVIYYICENYGIALTSTSFSGVMLGTIPVFGLLFGHLCLHEPISLLQCGCAVCSIIGVALTTVGGSVSFSLPGLVLLLIAAISGSLFNVVSRSISEHFTALERTYIMFALGSAVFTAIALVQNRSDLSAILIPLRSSSFWFAIFYLALVSSVGAFLLLNFANSYISSGTVSMFTNFSTVISVLAGIFLMGDMFSLPQLAGIVIITVSMFVVSLPQPSHT